MATKKPERTARQTLPADTRRPRRVKATGSRKQATVQGGAAPELAGGQASPQRVYVLSDSTGNLPRHMLASFLTQFPPGAFDVRYRAFIDSGEKVEAAYEQIRESPGIVFHATVSPPLKRQIKQLGAAAGLPVCDLTGGFVDFLASASGLEPSADRRRLHEVDDVYHKRIEAIEFTLEHDDGLGLETLGQADVVLTGISRTSKTPTSIYLAQQGYKAANVALAIEVEPPRELLAMPPGKVIGLVIDPKRLAEIRARRQMVAWGMSRTQYSEDEAVEREVAWSRRLFARQEWAVLDVTGQAIEETAARIIERLGLGYRRRA